MPIFSDLEKSAILKIHHFGSPSQFYEGHSDLDVIWIIVKQKTKSNPVSNSYF